MKIINLIELEQWIILAGNYSSIIQNIVFHYRHTDNKYSSNSADFPVHSCAVRKLFYETESVFKFFDINNHYDCYIRGTNFSAAVFYSGMGLSADNHGIFRYLPFDLYLFPDSRLWKRGQRLFSAD